jgi:hypothetical protein
MDLFHFFLLWKFNRNDANLDQKTIMPQGFCQRRNDLCQFEMIAANTREPPTGNRHPLSLRYDQA